MVGKSNGADICRKDTGEKGQPGADCTRANCENHPRPDIFRRQYRENHPDIQKHGGREDLRSPHAIVLDHNSPPSQTQHAESHLAIRTFVSEQRIEYFYDVGRGIGHQVLLEEGLALPGEVLLGADSHTPHAGAFGVFSAGIGHTEMASLWALGHLWLRVPESMKIVVRGELPRGVTAKDLALHVIGDLKADAGLYMSVEWHGEAVRALTIDQRSVLTNMMTEMGVKNSYIPPDQKVFDYLRAGRSGRMNPFTPTTMPRMPASSNTTHLRWCRWSPVPMRWTTSCRLRR